MLHPRPHRHLSSGEIAVKCLSIIEYKINKKMFITKPNPTRFLKQNWNAILNHVLVLEVFPITLLNKLFIRTMSDSRWAVGLNSLRHCRSFVWQWDKLGRGAGTLLCERGLKLGDCVTIYLWVMGNLVYLRHWLLDFYDFYLHHEHTWGRVFRLRK